MKKASEFKRNVGSYLDETRPKRQRTTGYIAFFVIMLFAAYVFGRNDASSEKAMAAALPISVEPAEQAGKCELPEIHPNPSYQSSWEYVLFYCNEIIDTSRRYNLEPELVSSIILLESGGDSNAISQSGAVGLMQIMSSDGLSRQLYGDYFFDRPTVSELLNPVYNIEWGVSHLAGLVENYRDLREALYHYGPIDVGYDYADSIMSMFDALN